MKQFLRSKRRVTGLLVLPAIGALALAGCAVGGAEPSATGGSSDEPVSFTWSFSTPNNFESPYEMIGKKYMEENPHVTIEFDPIPTAQYAETMSTRLQGGNAADLLMVAPGVGGPTTVNSLAAAHLLEPVADEAALDSIPESSASLFEFDGTVYGQPIGSTVYGLVYNGATADDLGVSAIPETTDELLSLCEEAAGDGSSYIVYSGVAGANTLAVVLSATRVYAADPDWNQQRTDGEVTFADSGWRDVFETIIAMRDAQCFQPGAEGAAFDAITQNLLSGTAAAAFIPSNFALTLNAQAKSEDFVAQTFPPAEGEQPFAVVNPEYAVGINAKSPVKDAVADFTAWLAQPENATQFASFAGTIPASEFDAADLPSIYGDTTREVVASGAYVPAPQTSYPNPNVQPTLVKAVQAVYLDQMTVDQALEELDAAWDK